MLTVVCGIAAAAMLAIGSNLVVPIGANFGGAIDLLGVASMMACLGFADGE